MSKEQAMSRVVRFEAELSDKKQAMTPLLAEALQKHVNQLLADSTWGGAPVPIKGEFSVGPLTLRWEHTVD